MIKTVYLAGGCFWGLQKLMKAVPGVMGTVCGYANGTGQEDADYETVCTGRTGFRETVCVDYEEEKVSLERIIFTFLRAIDPEAVNRQGNDIGTQYQSGMYYLPEDEETRRIVERITRIEKERRPGFAVETGPLRNFFPAEDYHQDYLDRYPGGYCHISPQMIREAGRERIDPGEYPRPEENMIRERLSPEQYRVVRENGTEPPFDNPYWDQDEPGIYVDIVTGEPLFSSADKFQSSCGWPAFSAPVEEAVIVKKQDTSFGMCRTEVRSRSGNSHLGHVFTGPGEGPEEVRYCINSAALRFVPLDRMEREGYGYLKEAVQKKGRVK